MRTPFDGPISGPLLHPDHRERTEDFDYFIACIERAMRSGQVSIDDIMEEVGEVAARDAVAYPEFEAHVTEYHRTELGRARATLGPQAVAIVHGLASIVYAHGFTHSEVGHKRHQLRGQVRSLFETVDAINHYLHDDRYDALVDEQTEAAD